VLATTGRHGDKGLAYAVDQASHRTGLAHQSIESLSGPELRAIAVSVGHAANIRYSVDG
jgi:hypothetical protein